MSKVVEVVVNGHKYLRRGNFLTHTEVATHEKVDADGNPFTVHGHWRELAEPIDAAGDGR